MKPDVLVIGGGAAGILAAWNAARHGAKALILEKTDRIGTKILISGGGKCNVAHDGPLEDVIRAFRQNEAVFLRPACYRLPNSEIIRLFTDRGLEVYTRPNGRVFPVHQTAKDVVAILEGYLAEAGVEVRRECPVTALRTDGRMLGVETPHGPIDCEHVVLSTGGSSYPKTGTTGDGWPWARALGHTIVPVRAALAPMYMELEGADPRAGVSLREVLLRARIGREIARWRGDLLFTHRGVSGPTVLGISRVVAERWSEGPVTLDVDLLPDENHDALGSRLREFCSGKKRISAFLDGVVPARLVPEVLEAAGVEESPASGLGKKSVNRMVETIKAWPLGKVRAVPLERGECVAGGISLDEVDPKTMRSRLVPGLYLCGEVLDIAGPVGGYNLQAAFATGFVAGETAALDAAG